ncbi:hypothetical protein CEXT_341331 [Caerostris extrusa]|uniref:Uncharacterized protein n=1 Tax=Caerostris extrusa TaxID=172846 RepID=A0AAV4QN80_CAEEX|nr:hypothetical protein CEXT_341331 [Caerostris extrusa]
MSRIVMWKLGDVISRIVIRPVKQETDPGIESRREIRERLNDRKQVHGKRFLPDMMTRTAHELLLLLLIPAAINIDRRNRKMIALVSRLPP